MNCKQKGVVGGGSSPIVIFASGEVSGLVHPYLALLSSDNVFHGLVVGVGVGVKKTDDGGLARYVTKILFKGWRISGQHQIFGEFYRMGMKLAFDHRCPQVFKVGVTMTIVSQELAEGIGRVVNIF